MRHESDIATSGAQRRSINFAARHGITGTALAAKQFGPVNYVVEGYLAQGVTLLAGAPKIGKSWLALNIAQAVAAGTLVFGTVPCRGGYVLYLALEDNERRLKVRCELMGATPSERITFVTEWPTIDDGGLEEMEAWIASVPDPVLIVVDVLAKVRPQTRGDAQLYETDYRALSGMQKIANDHNIAILIITHTRKAGADDPFDAVSGTRGLTGAADTVLVLRREMNAGHALLYGRGRDVAESDTALQFEAERGTWRVLGDAADFACSGERQLVLETLAEAARPMTAHEVTEACGGEYHAIRRMLMRMAGAGEIDRAGRGLYACRNGRTVASGDEAGDLLDIAAMG